MSTHPPAAWIEWMSAGDAPPGEVGRHVDGCDRCRQQVAELRRGREAFLAARPAGPFVARLAERREAKVPARPPAWRWVWAPLAAAAALTFVVWRPVERPAVLPKGAAFQVVALRPGSATPEPVAEDATLAAGDALRFSYRAPADGHLLVLDLDGAGAVTVLHPYGGGRGAPVAANDEAFLPGSIVLDAAPGPEWLIAVFDTSPLDAAPLLAQLAGQRGGGRPRLSCGSCRVSALRIQKRP